MNKYNIKNILQDEIRYHTDEIIKHKDLAQKRQSKRQKIQATKHFHKRFQTVKIAKAIGLEVCESCGGLK